jgi:hypothetical protein
MLLSPGRFIFLPVYVTLKSEFIRKRCLFMLPELRDRLKELELRMIDLRGYL